MSAMGRPGDEVMPRARAGGHQGQGRAGTSAGQERQDH